ncbi:CHAT domain [Trypanosoma melophagium]|uniref:CHAT domain n=1 Tax=Trypanosoma melophagium TaxID=715481 RepID=UPI003519F6AF|nr:CHAT domain [Trypanosoma melophagium]
MGERVNICDLYRSYCAEEGCRANSAVLQYIEDRGAMHSLVQLMLGNNYLGPRGLRPVIRLVAYCQTLTQLNLDGNGANNDTVEELCVVLESHMGVKSVSLRSNPITATGGKRLLLLVERNPRITFLDLTETDVFEAIIYKIGVVTAANRRRAMEETPQLVLSEIDEQCQQQQLQQSRGYMSSLQARTATEVPSLSLLPPVVKETATTTAASTATTVGATTTTTTSASPTTTTTTTTMAGAPTTTTTTIARGGIKRYSVLKRETFSPASKGAPAITSIQPRPPIPAIASRESTRLPELQRQQLLRRYREKALLFREINSSMASRVADRAREELMLLEKSMNNQKKAILLESITDKKTPPPAQKEIKESTDTIDTNADTDTVPLTSTTPPHQEQEQYQEQQQQQQQQQQGDGKEGKNKESNMDSPSGGVNETENPFAETDGDIVHTNPADNMPFGSEDTELHPREFKTSSNREKLITDNDNLIENVDDNNEDDIPLGLLQVSPQWMALDSSEQFQRLFNTGCRCYVKHDFDTAYTAWNEAMSIAVKKKNREWMAVLTNNLQRLSYELLVREGVDHLERDKLEEADTSFQRAMEVAQKSHNAKWESDMHKARKDVQHAVFRRCHESALRLFEQAKNQQPQKVTDDDYFIIPGTDVLVQHTEAYVNEWPRLLLVKEAVETWAASRLVLQRIGGSASRELESIITQSLDDVACFLARRCFDTEDTLSLSWMRTSRYNYQECIMLCTLWTDMASCDKFSEYHKLFAALAAAQIGNYYLATNQLTHAQTQFDILESLAVEIGDPLLRAAGHTFSALVNWQRARYAVTESLLRAALLEWGALSELGIVQNVHLNDSEMSSNSKNGKVNSNSFSGGGTGSGGDNKKSTNGNDANAVCSSKLMGSIPRDYIGLMEAVSYKYLISSIASTYRYREALEVLERSLLCKYRDLLFEKLKVNFTAQPTLDQIVATSSQIRSPFIYQLVTQRYEWSSEERCFTIEEKLLMWVVPQGNEMRFVEVGVTKDFKVPSINSLVEVVRRELLLDPFSTSNSTNRDNSNNIKNNTNTTIDTTTGTTTATGTGTTTTLNNNNNNNNNNSNSNNVAEDIIMTFPKRSWVEPLQTLYAIFVDPVVEFLRALDPLFLSKNGVITLIPTERLWLVPFNALIARNGNFLVEDFAVQLAFCATQCAFSALSVRRVLQRDLYRDVVLVQREAETPAMHLLAHVLFPFDALRSTREGNAVVRTLAEHKRHMDEASGTTTSETVVDDLNTFRELLPKSRIVHIAASTTSGTRNDDGTAGAICIAASREQIVLLRSSEIARMELYAELVVMSHTNMSTSRVMGTHDDVQGLIRGFLSGGVPCVIVGQWCTPDMVPSDLFSKFYELLAEAHKKQQRGPSTHSSARAATASVQAPMNPSNSKDETGARDTADLHRHKALVLAWAIRALLEESFFRFSPRAWAGYCCIGYGSYQ